MAYLYPSMDDVVEVHRRTITVSGGGVDGALDLGPLESVLQNIQNDDWYPTFDGKLTHLFFCACKFHCFRDGNKRIAITLCVDMLNRNGYLGSLLRFMRESENISYHVAAGRISKELLSRWMAAVLVGADDDESLKLEILHAISQELP
jgi:death-on-curing protein